MVCVLVYMRVRVLVCVWRVVVVVYYQVKLKNEKAKNIAAANVRLD